MYVNPFWFGVFATISLMAILLLVLAVCAAKDKDDE